MCRISLFISALALFALAAAPVFAQENRTQGRDVSGQVVQYRFKTYDPYAKYKSQGYDTRMTFPHMWDGQDWETPAWNASWTPERAIHAFYANGTFQKEVMRDGLPGLRVGPTFYKLSDHDQRRAVKLLTDTRGLFANGQQTRLQLFDWATSENIGSYGPEHGLILK